MHVSWVQAAQDIRELGVEEQQCGVGADALVQEPRPRGQSQGKQSDGCGSGKYPYPHRHLLLAHYATASLVGGVTAPNAYRASGSGRSAPLLGQARCSPAISACRPQRNPLGMRSPLPCVHYYKCRAATLQTVLVLAATLTASRGQDRPIALVLRKVYMGGWCIASLLHTVGSIDAHLAGYAHSLQLEAADCYLAAPAVGNSGRRVEHLYSCCRPSRSNASFPISVCICHWTLGGGGLLLKV